MEIIWSAKARITYFGVLDYRLPIFDDRLKKCLVFCSFA